MIFQKILKELCEGEEFSATVTDTWQTSDGHTIVAATFHYEPLKRNLKLTDLSPEIIQNIVKRAPLSAIDNIRLVSVRTRNSKVKRFFLDLATVELPSSRIYQPSPTVACDRTPRLEH